MLQSHYEFVAAIFESGPRLVARYFGLVLFDLGKYLSAPVSELFCIRPNSLQSFLSVITFICCIQLPSQ